MKKFEDHNPIAIFIYFMATTGIAMFYNNPLIVALSMLGSAALFFIRNGLYEFKSHIFFFGLFLAASIINPLFYHNGVTVLFVMNNTPVTLEALLYGVNAAGMLVSVMYWFRSFSQIMTSDKLLYLLGAVSPKLSLILSMALRYVPLFKNQAVKISRAQKTLGIYKEDNIVDSIKGGARIFSIMTTWTLENGIITADSMAARGYGIGKRTSFSVFKFRPADFLLICVTAVLCGFIVAGAALGFIGFEFYPAIRFAPFKLPAYLVYISYGALVFLPVVIEMEESFKWKYLRSKI